MQVYLNVSPNDRLLYLQRATSFWRSLLFLRVMQSADQCCEQLNRQKVTYVICDFINIVSYSFLLRWMTGIQRSAGRCQGRQPAVGGVWKPSCLCNSTMFCHTASRLTPSLTRCLLYDLLLLAWSSSTLFLQVHSRCLTYGPVRLPSTSLVNFVCNFWSSFVDVLLWFFGVQVLLYGFEIGMLKPFIFRNR